MTSYKTDTSIGRNARVTGFMFLFSLIFPTMNWTLILSKLIVTENVTATANNVMANEFLFRIGIVNELIFSVAVIVTALVLYILLKPVNKNLALLALFLKLTEAILWAAIASGHFIALLILNKQASLTVFELEQIQALVGFFLNIQTYLNASFPMLFLGLGFTIFNYLFFKSRYIPKTMASFGFISYLLIFVYALVNILVPEHNNIIKIICWTPSVFFELIIGPWLLIKGVNSQP